VTFAALFPHAGKTGVCSACGEIAFEAPGPFGVALCSSCRVDNAALAQRSEEAEKVWRSRMDEQRRAERVKLALAEVPEEYRGLTFHSPDLPLRVARQEAIAEAETSMHLTMVTIAGRHGSGKSTLASAMLGTAIMGGNRTAHWVSYPNLIRDRQKHGLGRGESPLVEMACEASLLVIDDLGLDPLKSEGSVYHVIHHRKAHNLHTIITTGFPRRTVGNITGLGDWYGGGMVRRIAEDRAKIILCSKGLNQ
jgi:DNA replication protein DnaC